MNIAILGSWLPQWNALYPRSKTSGSPPVARPLRGRHDVFDGRVGQVVA